MQTINDVPEMSEEWDARFYHRVMAAQQVDVALKVCDDIPADLEGLMIDGGCGSGLVDAALLRRFPRVSLYAVDLSVSMLTIAQKELDPAFAERVSYCQADLQNFILPGTAACFFSNAAMHWVKDHITMFQNIFSTLQPGGILASQMAYCGPHNRPWYAQMHALLQSIPHGDGTADVVSPVELVRAESENAAMQHAGFENIRITPFSHIFTFRNAPEHRLFMEKVILRAPLARIPSESLRTVLVDQAIAYSDEAIGPLKQCYESLRLVARRPATRH